MKTITASEAKEDFGQLMDNALAEPVSITQQGKPAHVLTSAADYQCFLELKQERLRAEIDMGFEQIEQGKTSNATVEEIADRVRQKFSPSKA